MESDSVRFNYDINFKFPSNNNQIHTLFENTIATSQQYLDGDVNNPHPNGYLKRLRLVCQIFSIAEAPLPNYLDEDTDAQRLVKTNEMLWNSPRFHLDCWTAKKPTSGTPQWFYAGAISLLRNMGYRYVTHNLVSFLTDDLAFEVGKDTLFGVSISDQGYGLLADQDILTLNGVWSQEIVWVRPYKTPIIIQGGEVVNVTQYQYTAEKRVALTTVSMLPQRDARISGTVSNAGPQTARITYTTMTGANTTDLASGGSTTIPNNYKGPVNAIMVGSTGQAIVTASEAYNA